MSKLEQEIAQPAVDVPDRLRVQMSHPRQYVRRRYLPGEVRLPDGRHVQVLLAVLIGLHAGERAQRVERGRWHVGRVAFHEIQEEEGRSALARSLFYPT